jgi:transposase
LIETGREGVLVVERWAGLRREYFVRGVGIKELARRYGIDRNTVRRALRADEPPRYERASRPSKLEPFKEEIHELLRAEPKLTGVRIRELIEPLGFDGGKSIVDDYLREVRPLFAAPRTFQRTIYRPGEICQFDLWQPSREIPVGHGQTRKGYVVVALLGYSRVGSGALVFSKEADDLLWGIARCLWSFGGLPATLVWDREGSLHAGGGRPTDAMAGLCGQLKSDWYFCEARDPQAKGAVEKLQQYLETNFEPGRAFASQLDFQLQLDHWFGKANARTHRGLRCRPIDRLAEELSAMRVLPGRELDLDRRFVMRVPPDPFLRFDTNDYSLDPAFVSRRVEVRVSQQRVTATVLDTGEQACSHERSFAKHRTITALEHARSLKILRGERRGVQIEVQQRSLDIYDALMA